VQNFNKHLFKKSLGIFFAIQNCLIKVPVQCKWFAGIPKKQDNHEKYFYQQLSPHAFRLYILVYFRWVCDGEPDCKNGEDEKSCKTGECDEKENAQSVLFSFSYCCTVLLRTLDTGTDVCSVSSSRKLFFAVGNCSSKLRVG
jgi:Low-density lipoprotein receptor domain class A